MAIVQALTTSFIKELLTATHNFSASGGHTFKIALYTADAVLGPDTAAYTTSNEISGVGYIAGGATLVNVEPGASGRTGFADFANVSWVGATFTARSALIYNSTAGGNSVAVLDFGVTKTIDNGTFTIRFPTGDAENAIIRILGS